MSGRYRFFSVERLTATMGQRIEKYLDLLNKSTALAAVSSLIPVLALVFAHPAAAGVQGSNHDLSQFGWSGGEICKVCHTPHTSTVNTQAPLWNHSVSSATYTVYTSPTMDVPTEQPTPGSVSRLCLSCHDGTVALDSFGGTTGTGTIADRANLGTDLRDDHPVGLQWKHQTQTGGSMNCLGCHQLTFDPNTQAYVFGQPGAEIKFFNGKIECASCHDVHNEEVMDVKLLRLPRANSQLCQHCHSM